MDGQDAVTGDVTISSSGSISVQGQNSYAVRSVTDLDGNFVSAGTIGVTGENSRGVSLEGDVSGNVEFRTVTAVSPGGEGAVIEGDVGGGVRANGTITAHGSKNATTTKKKTTRPFFF